MKYLKLFILLSILTSCKEEKEENLLLKAKVIHERVMTLDTHVDINVSNLGEHF